MTTGPISSPPPSLPTLPLLLILFLLAAWPARAQITSLSLNLTQPQLDCLNAVSFDLCTSNDPTFVCPVRYFLDQYMDPSYQRKLFVYLVDRFIYETNTSAAWLLSQLLTTGDTYSSYVDATYGTACSTDADTQTLIAGTTAAQSGSGKAWWIILMRQADFCTENQYFLMGSGCVCKEEKNCDETKTHPFTDVMRTMIFVDIVVIVVTLASIYVFTRHSQGLKKEYLLIIQTSSRTVEILQKAVSETWRVQMGEKLNKATAAETKQSSSPGELATGLSVKTSSSSPAPPLPTAAAVSSSAVKIRKRAANASISPSVPLPPSVVPPPLSFHRPTSTPPPPQEAAPDVAVTPSGPVEFGSK
jgi:hypothetical protein